MPARDTFHYEVREALEKDGWEITHDPYFLWIGQRKAYIDLGGEKVVLGAEKENQKIAVEIKSFIGPSAMAEFEDALGQFMIYLLALEEKEPDRELYLAVPLEFYRNFFLDPFFMRLIKRLNVSLIVFDQDEKIIKEWIK